MKWVATLIVVGIAIYALIYAPNNILGLLVLAFIVLIMKIYIR